MTVGAKIGDSLLDVAKDNDLDLEGKYTEFYHLINFKEMPSLYVLVIWKHSLSFLLIVFNTSTCAMRFK